MSLGPTQEQWRALDGGHRSRHGSLEKARQWVVLHHRGARAEGSTIWWSFLVSDRVVGLAWPVRRSDDWWLAMAPMGTVGW